MNIKSVIKTRFAHLCFSLPLLNPCYGQIIEGRENWVEDVPSPGALCAIKKAYQMTDIAFIPLDSIRANSHMKYKAGIEYKGLIYSSVKELDKFVGTDISLHTFMTALHNRRSVMYTENVSKYPYHGVNCGAYYGVVCNTFVSHALGLNVSMSTFDFSTADNMMLVKDQSSRGVRLADVVYEKGHVMLISKIYRDLLSGMAVELEISEAKRTGCRRFLLAGSKLEKNISEGKWTIYRYKYLELNTYNALTDFIALEGETMNTFKYNDDICTNLGDKACYIQGDTILLNISEGYKTLEIYKNSLLYQKLKVGKDTDVKLVGLPYGDYKARVINGKGRSDFTYWKVVDIRVKVDVNNKNVYFNSSNSVPVYLEFCDISGVRPTDGVFEFTENDIQRGVVNVSSFQMTNSQIKKGMFVKVHFECNYGRVVNKLLKWE